MAREEVKRRGMRTVGFLLLREYESRSIHSVYPRTNRWSRNFGNLLMHWAASMWGAITSVSKNRGRSSGLSSCGSEP